MEQAQYQPIPGMTNEGFNISYATAQGGCHPPHWHEELEIMYHLNGGGEISIAGRTYPLQKKHLIVIDSRQIHSTNTQDPALMFVSIHISKEYMEKYVPGLRNYHIHLTPDQINDDNFRDYLNICQLMQELIRTYMLNPVTLSMETEGYVLQIFARLIRVFGKTQVQLPSETDALTADRIRLVITYVEEHYREPVSLQDIADELGLSREYFCRFFRKNMGMSFLQYLNEVRCWHVCRDLMNTDLSVSEAMEKNGFTNQKLFNRAFRQIYGCTPSAMRKSRKGQKLS